MEIYKKYIVVNGHDACDTMNKLYSLGFGWKSTGLRADDFVMRRAFSMKETVAFVLDFNVLSHMSDEILNRFTEENKEELEEKGYEEIDLNYLLREKKIERILNGNEKKS